LRRRRRRAPVGDRGDRPAAPAGALFAAPGWKVFGQLRGRGRSRLGRSGATAVSDLRADGGGVLVGRGPARLPPLPGPPQDRGRGRKSPSKRNLSPIEPRGSMIASSRSARRLVLPRPTPTFPFPSRLGGCSCRIS